MRKHICFVAAIAISLQSAHALVIVNGAAGEDLDNASPFETLQAAVDYANANAETVIEIQTNGPLIGMSLEGVTLNQPLTIQAGSGFSPVLISPLILLPANTTELITLKGLEVSTQGLATPLLVGCSVTATNCIFNANPAGGGAYGPAVTAALESPDSDGILTLESCTLIGHIGLEAGRACRIYNLTRCVVEGRPVDLPPVFSVGISNAMNWRSGYATRLGSAQGFAEISEPRALNLTNCIVRGGVPLGWPNSTLDPAYYANENSTIGPVTAINTVFDGLNIGGRAEASRILNPALPANQNPGSQFLHCTFRSADAWGAFYFPGGQPATYTFSNTLFDLPSCNYGILTDANATLVGDANTYHVPGGIELYPYGSPAFEATEHTYMGAMAADPPLTNSDGRLTGPNPAVTAKALPLSPPVDTDIHNNPRPMPAGAARSDIGADEIDETAPAGVADWSAY